MPPVPKKIETKSEKTVLYPEITTRLFIRPGVATSYKGCTPLDAETARKLIGWRPAVEGQPHVCLDRQGNRIATLNNTTNRPFYPNIAEACMLEILRRKFRYTGETIIVNRYGEIDDGQHRLIGLVWADEELALDRRKPPASQKWSEYWPGDEKPYIEVLVAFGGDGEDETVNAINTGKSRSLQDVFYRSHYFVDLPHAKRLEAAKYAQYAVKFVWQRTKQAKYSFAPKRPHSESMDFTKRHEKLIECIKFVLIKPAIAPYLPLGTAAGLMYLMGSCATSLDDYLENPCEEVLNFKLWDKAKAYWSEMGNQMSRSLEPVKAAINDLPVEYGGSLGREIRQAIIIKGWSQFVEGEKLTRTNCEVELGHNRHNQPMLAEYPRIGGLDVDTEVFSAPEPGNQASTNCPSGKPHEWITEDGDKFCKHCYEPYSKKIHG